MTYTQSIEWFSILIRPVTYAHLDIQEPSMHTEQEHH
jgi:hypothetical protein